MNFDELKFKVVSKALVNKVQPLLLKLRAQCLNKKLEETINEVAKRDPKIMVAVTGIGTLSGAAIKAAEKELKARADYAELSGAERREAATALAWKNVYDEYPELSAAVFAPISRIPVTDDEATNLCIEILQAVVETKDMPAAEEKLFMQPPSGDFWQSDLADMEAVVRAVNRFRERVE